MNKREECLEEAKKAVVKGREQFHGKPEDTFPIIARLWDTYLDSRQDKTKPLSAQDVQIMMILLKVGRSLTGGSLDNFIDMAGYAACAYEYYAKEIGY